MIYKRQEEYYRALNLSNNQGESTEFVYFMLDLMREALLEIVEQNRMTDKMTDKMTDREMERWKIVKTYLQDNKEIKNSDVQKLCSVSESTAKRFLKNMEEYGLLESIGKNKNKRYKMFGDG